MNRKFGKLAGGNIKYAPDALRLNDVFYCTPSDETYISAGYLHVVEDNRPADKVGVYYTPIGWEQQDDKIIRTWEEHQLVAPVIVKRYSKLKIIVESKKIGKWDALKSFISAAGYDDEWNACQFLASDYEQFDIAKKAVIDASVMTEDEVNSVLDKAEDPTIA